MTETRSDRQRNVEKLGHTNDQLYAEEVAKSEMEHEEPIIVRFFILYSAKLRMLQLYYVFFSKKAKLTSMRRRKLIPTHFK